MDILEKLDLNVQKILIEAKRFCKAYGSPYLSREHLFLALLEDHPEMILSSVPGLSSRELLRIKEELQKSLSTTSVPTEGKIKVEDDVKEVLEEAVREARREGRRKAHLEHLAYAILKMREPVQIFSRSRFDIPLEELTSAEALPVVAREKEIEIVLETLLRREKSNPLLIGPPGVGKETIVRGVALRLKKGDVPDELREKRIFRLRLSHLLSSPEGIPGFLRKTRAILEELRDSGGILYMRDIHLIESQVEVRPGSFLKRLWEATGIPIIATVTDVAYRKFMESDPDLLSFFRPIKIRELGEKETLDVLLKMREDLEKVFGVEFNEQALRSLVRLSGRYIRNRYFPDKALDILDQASAKVKLKGKKKVEPKDIEDVIGNLTGLPIGELEEPLQERLKNLENFLKSRIVGQDHVIDEIGGLVRLKIRNLDVRPERPNGIFLFTGPTGVGKTEMAKCLAEFLFGSRRKLIRLDMSEFREPHTISKLIGSPPGYVGYEEDGNLVTRILDNPFSVLLLDEMEKAHPDVHNLFLHVFDEGVLTDSKGRRASFSDVIIIMTANIREEGIKGTGFARDLFESKHIMKTLEDWFSKEFLNRLDGVLVFNPLKPEDVELIVQHIAERVRNNFREKGIEIQFDRQVLKMVAERGYSPEYGARFLERTFEELVLTPLVNKLPPGANGIAVKVRLKKGELSFEW